MQDWKLDDYRKDLENTFTEASQVSKVIASGLPENARGLYLGVFPPNNDLNAPGVITVEIESSRYGSIYFRKFHMRARQEVAINADGMQAAKVSVVGNSIGSAGGSNIQVTAMPGLNPPDQRYSRKVYYLQTWTSLGDATAIVPVPSGAVAFIPYTTAPNWIWSSYDVLNAQTQLTTPLVAGVEYPIKGTHYTPSDIGVKGLWVLEL